MRRGLFWALAFLVASLAVGCSGSKPAENPAQPNVVFILTDDLDYDSAQLFPSLRSRLIEEGASFDNAFISDSLCCPSRSTILTGLYAHNHGVKSNAPPDGGFSQFHSGGHEEDTIAVSLQQSGYRNGLFGKYLNDYPGDDPTYVPPGWDEWHAWNDTIGEDKADRQAEQEAGTPANQKANPEYYGYKLNENGQVVSYGNGSDDYITDVLSDKATDFVRNATSDAKPFFLYLAPTAPHGPPLPAERHQGAFSDKKAPRPPSFDEEDVSGKPPWIRGMDRFSDDDVSRIDRLYRRRLGTMLAVDEMVDSLIQELDDDGALDNTFVFFTSDNGFLQGQHRIRHDKRYPYEESVRTPLFVRGPGVPAGSKVEKLVVNTDFAPTFADLTGVSFPAGEQADGRSFAPLLRGEDPPWRSAVLLEWFGQESARRNLPAYEAIRTETDKYIEYASGDKELYDLQADPYELDNAYEGADSSLIADLTTRLDALRSCTGDGCREAEDAL